MEICLLDVKCKVRVNWKMLRNWIDKYYYSSNAEFVSFSLEYLYLFHNKNTHTWHNNILSREGDGIFRKGKCDQTKAILDWIPVLIWSTFLFQKSSLPHSDYYNANQQIHLQFDSSLCANEYRISQKCLFSGSSYIMKSDIIMTCK